MKHILEESPHFKKGVQNFKENKVRKITKNYQWVIQLVSKIKWNGIYSKNSSYCYLGEEAGQIKIGFLIAEKFISEKCLPCSDEDLRRIDIYRRVKNIYPRPFK
jgi:hypothetical protein